jgi:hypothetical protein
MRRTSGSTFAPEPNAVLTTSEVARWLRKSERTVERLFVSFLPGRYLAAHVLARIEELRRERAVARRKDGGAAGD